MSEGMHSDYENTEWSEMALNIDINDPLPFSIDLGFQSDLDDDIISEGLQQEFEKNGISLSPEAIISVEETDSEWLITDSNREYTVRRAKDKLDVHRSLLGLALIDRDYRVVQANKFHRERFPGLIGEICYEFVNGFDKPCAWCPVKLAREDGLAHLALSASPKTESGRELAYSQIVAVPYKRDEFGDVSIVLEMIFDFTKSKTEHYKRGGRLHSFCRELLDKILRVTTEDDIFYLILFGAVSEDGLDFDEAEIIKLKRETEESEFIVSQRYVLKNEDFSSQKMEESDINTFIGMLMSKVQVEESGTWLHDFTPFLEEILDSNIPVRINIREVAAALSEQKRESCAILLLRNKKDNSFLYDEKLIDLDLFLSSIQRVYDIRQKIAGIQTATKNLENYLSQWKEEEGPLFSAVPLAIGKIHNLKSICNKIRESTSILRDLHPPGSKYSTIHGDLVTNLSRCVNDLSGIADSMSSILKMSTPNFYSVALSEIIEKTEWLFEQDLKKGKVNIINHLPSELEIECDGDLISQVFYNLIENSIRALGFVQRKDKKIEIGLNSRYSEGVEIRFSDNASGIASYDVPLIWNRFFSSRWKGTGLGLYFVKYVIEVVHKGNIAVESEWGKETTFTIALPKTQANPGKEQR